MLLHNIDKLIAEASNPPSAAHQVYAPAKILNFGVAPIAGAAFGGATHGPLGALAGGAAGLGLGALNHHMNTPKGYKGRWTRNYAVYDYNDPYNK